MGVRWSVPYRRQRARFVKVPPKRNVIFLAPPALHAVIDLHWIDGRNGSYPCLGDGCCLCPAEIREFCYAAVAFHNGYEGNRMVWCYGILPIGDPSCKLALEDFQGDLVEVGKKDNDKLASLSMFERKPLSPELKRLRETFPLFDLKAALLARWQLTEENDDARRGVESSSKLYREFSA